MTGPLVEVEDLVLDIPTEEGVAHILRGVSLTIPRGSTLGIVGESGSGKSMLLRSVLGLTPARARLTGRIVLDGTDLSTLSLVDRRRFIGRRVGIVFQNPMTSLNPVLPISQQVVEAARYHLGMSKQAARKLAIDLLGQVGIPNAAKRIDDYPHQFSGGMRQRVMIAMALTCEPELLVADEATTALDVTIQKEILDLLERLQSSRDMTMVLVSHDLSVVSSRTDDVVVMYGGRIVERRPTAELFAGTPHPYAEALLRAIPRIDRPPHSRLATMTGAPPSVYSETLPVDEADARDRVRWTSIEEATR